ncbi:amidohydrolase [Psychrobacillus sp. BL-248-WT-3]|uniref:amidohydrolase n=1 Tax=Psychrobacillus sp. BL-248-WT-3 TaxID=2725306 RepID=UPI00146D19BB|nr:amidohydrolase [Psychrobacillus sp. BL-248-WT-3]NME06423.1 amidohydrolase [Psychrobacillus sp. BL-248-WT-3]
MKTLWTDGSIYTMDSENSMTEAVLTEGGKIIRTGEKEKLLPMADIVISLEGSAMYPGLVDSHIHLIGHGEKLSYLDLSGFTSIEDIVTEVRKKVVPGQWYVTEGWNDNNLIESRPITRADLDGVIQESPIVLKRICRHVLVANSKAMEIAGITEETTSPVGGMIGRDDNGRLNGLFYDKAQNLITSHIPPVTSDYLADVIRLSIQDLLSKGLTGVHTEDMSYYGPYNVPLKAYHDAVEENFKVHLLRHHLVFEQMQGEVPSEFIEFGAMKIFVDGSLGGRTALLSTDYFDATGTQGVAVHPEEKLEQLVKIAREYQENIAVHVIGDKATELILDVIEKYPPPHPKKDRLIHVNVLRKDLIERMRKLPLVLDIQPIFVPSDFPWVRERLGSERMEWAYAWKTLIAAGLECSGGSDSPIENADPFLAMDAAVNNVWNPAQSLSLYEALCLYTIGSAKAIGKGLSRGKIESGYDADFTIVNEPLTVSNLAKVSVCKTVVAGNIVYERK